MSSDVITAAIYARKSVEEDSSNSVDNQIERGISYCKLQGWNYIVYRDEGISGKDTNREGFQQMMKDAEKGRFQYIITYKLDRISRNVADFANFTKKLDQLGIGYISLTENFDTSTPIGRAMMYIAAVFAQLERETIAERVRDNMLDNAKKGLYLGGPIPFGYEKGYEEVEIHGKKKRFTIPKINPDEAEIVRKFYNWYLEFGGSLRRVAYKANQDGIRTKNGRLWSAIKIARILSNPLYCIADEAAYRYFKNETQVILASDKSDFNGKNGLRAYNRRRNSRNAEKLRDESEWIISVGMHQGIIPGEIWVAVQKKLKENANKPPRKGTGYKGLLSYLIRCGKCGAPMGYYTMKKKKGNKKEFGYYRCSTKYYYGGDCDQKNINAEVIETAIIDTLKKVCSDRIFVENALRKAKELIEKKKAPLLKELERLKREIEKNNMEIKNLIVALGRQTLPENLIEERIKELQQDNIELNNRIVDINNELSILGSSDDVDVVFDHIKKFETSFDSMDFEQKRFFLRTIIKDIIVEDDTATVNLFFVPSQNIGGLVNSSRTEFHELQNCIPFHIDLMRHFDNLRTSKLKNEMSSLDTFGKALRFLRLQKGLSQAALAKKVNCCEATIFCYEHDKVKPQMRIARKLAAVLGDESLIKFLKPNVERCSAKSFGEALKLARIKKGLTQVELAQKTGCSRTNLYRYERGLSYPRKRNLEKLIKVLGEEYLKNFL